MDVGKKVRHAGATKRDDDDDKAYPASIASLFASLRQYWAIHSGDRAAGERVSADDFKADPPKQFRDAVDYVYDNFRKLRRLDEDGVNNYKSAAQRFQLLERGGEATELGFEDIIIAAEWVGLTAAQLMVFCNLTSIERRAENRHDNPKEVLLKKLEEYERVMMRLRQIIEGGKDKHILYNLHPTSEHKYYVREELLIKLVEARNNE